MARKLPLHPKHPERICWGCDKYCAADDLRCGNGTDRAQHPAEILGEDWMDYGLDAEAAAAASNDATTDDPSDRDATRTSDDDAPGVGATHDVPATDTAADEAAARDAAIVPEPPGGSGKR